MKYLLLSAIILLQGCASLQDKTQHIDGRENRPSFFESLERYDVHVVFIR